MKKAKALFTAGIIVIVAGASAVCLYLNDSGKLNFGETESVVQGNDVVQDKETEDSLDVGGNSAENLSRQSETENNNDLQNKEETEEIDTVSLNEFLSTFSKLYFSQDRTYSQNDADGYELLRFAYLYATVYENREDIVTEYFDDDIGVYNGIKASRAQDIINKFFGIEISEESVYTEKTYQFFMYRDGYFYTPAADGVGFTDITVVDSAIKSGDTVSVFFTVYTDGVNTDMTAVQAKETGTVFAKGTAQLVAKDGEFTLTEYSIDL